MPVYELKESLIGLVQLGPTGEGYLTKRINIPEGMRNQVLTIDVINDMGGAWGNTQLAPSPAATQFFITPFPPQITNETWGLDGREFSNSGPLASDSTVLYKETSIAGNGEPQDRPFDTIYQQFPNDDVGAHPTQTWYTPTLYLTMMVWNAELVDVPIKYSVYIKTKQTKCSKVESTMGRYKEFLEVQCRNLTSTGVMIAENRLVGQTFPMWKFGGIRSELMVSSATAAQYFNRIASSDAEDMQTLASMQDRFGEATQMVAFDQAFGTSIVPTPQWVRILDVAGVTSGIIRSQAPPLKFNNDGTTQML
jgi:hypothetical protein|tara:strand:- start:1075 stop:1998 length:924 start_codon:yes stop_codon:yes gene_type:complete